MSGFWYLYHPHLRVTVLVNTPAATTYEVHVTEAITGTELVKITTIAGTFSYYDLIVPRTSIPPGVGADLGTNGNPINLNLEWRRATGAGTATITFVEAVAIDMSF
jgi:hypothetical protein